MKFENTFLLKDYFNYYFPGIIWLLCLFAVILPIENLQALGEFLQSWNIVFVQVSGVIWLLFLALIPYLVGFVMNPLGEMLTEFLRKRGNDAVKWSTEPSEPLNKLGLSVDEVEIIQKQATKIFGMKKLPSSENFNHIRAFVANHGGGGYDLSVRTLDLVNFAEAMLPPVPILFLILGTRLLQTSGIAGSGLLLLAVYITWALRRRYLYLRGYWVMHVHRAFIAIAAERQTLVTSGKK
ncbi:MAG: hypothetical protein EPO32_10260 [Anaerolineae bacterium]|nr:MAG: hypothetical protein EPO32_10260 [Anaerolineae bacterium]